MGITMSFHRLDRFSIATALFLTLSVCTSSATPRKREELVLAKSAEDRVLTGRIAALAPAISVDEARQVAATSYTTGQELRRTWRVVWPPGVQNFLVNIGKRKGGLCFQWATELLIRLDALRLKTIELHWAESFARTASEHNVIVVTAKGQPFEQGILLDNWRYSGQLAWGSVAGDPHYHWRENKPELDRRMGKPSDHRALTDVKRRSVPVHAGN